MLFLLRKIARRTDLAGEVYLKILYTIVDLPEGS